MFFFHFLLLTCSSSVYLGSDGVDGSPHTSSRVTNWSTWTNKKNKKGGKAWLPGLAWPDLEPANMDPITGHLHDYTVGKSTEKM